MAVVQILESRMDTKEAVAAVAQETERLVAEVASLQYNLELKGVECDKAKEAILQATQKLAKVETHPQNDV
eukprot:7892941-Ditylum_brightwellii.AAC.1